MFQRNVLITQNIEVKSKHFLMSFQDAEIAAMTHMGQFFEFNVPGLENMLRIPISVSRVQGDCVSILYRVVGSGTGALSKMRAGEAINLIGPLGQGFPKTLLAHTEVILVAGGIGFAPFPYVMDTLPNWTLFYGMRDISECLLDDLVCQQGVKAKIFITTDNGSGGTQGLVTESLETYLKQTHSGDKVIFCCGPHRLLQRVCEIADQYGIESYISMEEMMACGIGICVGCVHPIRDVRHPAGWEYKKICKEGPIFRGSDILWSPIYDLTYASS